MSQNGSKEVGCAFVVSLYLWTEGIELEHKKYESYGDLDLMEGGTIVDNRNEDSMVRQIEKNLSQNINDNLFLVGKEPDGRMNPQSNSLVVNHNMSNPGTMNAFQVEETYLKGKNKVRRDSSALDPEFPLVSYEHIDDSLAISRAEYIRQAREACLRQLSDLQVYSRPYDVNYMHPETTIIPESPPKKSKTWNLFREGHEDRRTEDKWPSMDAAARSENATPQELNSFRFLVVRMVCAVVLFLTVFVIDKLDLKIGNLSNEKVEEYITQNDVMDNIEDYIVTWLK